MNGAWWARPSTNRDEIRQLLHRDRLYAAYALGDLSPGLWEHSRWYMAGRGQEPEALILLFHGLEPSVLFCFGPRAGVAALAARVPWLERVYFAGRAEHVMAVEPWLRLNWQTPMWRMAVSAAEFRPVPDETEAGEWARNGEMNRGCARRLSMGDLPALYRLYAYGGADAFAPYQLEQGVFFGYWDGDELVAVAGTHFVSRQEKVAAVGNVFTHPAYRRRGLGTAVTSAVTAELLAQGMDVVLNVAQRNTPAISLYRRLGYRCVASYVEGIAYRWTKA